MLTISSKRELKYHVPYPAAATYSTTPTQDMSRPILSSSQADAPATEKPLRVSNDGYIRLSFSEIRNVDLQHLITGLDEDTPAISSEGALLTTITGYTEWVSTTVPSITIGWDWQLDTALNRIRLHRVNPPRSNLMLQDIHQTDLGPAKTSAMLEVFIDKLNWQAHTRDHISMVCAR
jgi:hypothetical protein